MIRREGFLICTFFSHVFARVRETLICLPAGSLFLSFLVFLHCFYAWSGIPQDCMERHDSRCFFRLGLLNSVAFHFLRLPFLTLLFSEKNGERNGRYYHISVSVA